MGRAINVTRTPNVGVENKPVIISTGVVGTIAKQRETSQKTSISFMKIYGSGKIPMKAHKILFEEACSRATEKAELRKDDIQFVLAGDLINQIPLQACRYGQHPYLGLFGACSTSMEGLALGASIVNAKVQNIY